MRLYHLPPALAILAIGAHASTKSTTSQEHLTPFALAVRDPFDIPPIHPDDIPPEEVPPENVSPINDPEDVPPTEIPGGGYGELTPVSPDGAQEVQYSPAPTPNPCLTGDECIEITKEIADQVLNQLAPGPSLGSSSSDGSTTANVGSAIMSGFNTLTPAPTPSTTYLNADIATSLASAAYAQPYVALLDSDQQEMYLSKPVCFFAAAERMYASYATVASTSALDRRQVTLTTTGSPAATTTTLDTSAMQQSFFATGLPQQILSVYNTAAGSGYTTAATTCTGFGANGMTFGTNFVQKVQTTPTTVAAVKSEAGRQAALMWSGMVSGLLFWVFLGLFNERLRTL